jgi:hypothetical protein
VQSGNQRPGRAGQSQQWSADADVSEENTGVAVLQARAALMRLSAKAGYLVLQKRDFMAAMGGQTDGFAGVLEEGPEGKRSRRAGSDPQLAAPPPPYFW